MHAPFRSTRTLGHWLLFLFALMLSPASWAQRGGDGEYQILQAVYGTEQASIDVTQRLRQLVGRDQRFKLTNDLFNADPAPGKRKTLWVQARGQDGQTRSFEYRENNWVDGARFTGWGGGQWGQGPGHGQGQGPGWQGGGGWQQGHDGGPIEQATYGTEESRIDVTGRIRQLALHERGFSVDSRLFAGDPAPGQYKTLRIHLRGQGGRYAEYPDTSWVDTSQLAGGGAGSYPGNDQGYGRLAIHRAIYGDGYRQVDVTARLRSRVQGGRLDVWVDNDLAGVDPAPRVRKTLRVEFSQGNGRVQEVTVEERQQLRLP